MLVTDGLTSPSSSVQLSLNQDAYLHNAARTENNSILEDWQNHLDIKMPNPARLT